MPANDAVFCRFACRQLDHVFRRAVFARNCIVADARGDDRHVGIDSANLPVGTDEDHVERFERIFHPELDRRVAVENEDHTGMRRNGFAIHQPALALRFGSRDFER